VQPNPSGNTFGQLPTTSTSQINGFLSGAGLDYSRYDITNLSTKTLINFRANIASANLTLLESSRKPDIMTPDIYGSYYVQVFKGYFVAPSAGIYVFRGLADDAMELFVSTFSGSAEINYTAPLISSLYYSQSESTRNYYVANASQLTGSFYFAAGESRYIEVYHMNGAGGGNLLVSV
jgi:hypothetical protein